MPTGQAIREELLRWGLIHVLGTVTAAVGTGARLRDTTRLQSLGHPSTAYDGAWVRATTAAGNVDGEQVKVDYLDQTNGDLYVTPSFSAAPNTSTTYEIWAHGLNPDDVDRTRDQALTQICSQWALQPLSLLTNGDFEDGATAVTPTNWTNQAGGAGTFLKQALSFPTEFARNSALLTNGAANGYGQSASLYTQPSMEFYCYVPVSARVGTAELIVRDITNGANITLSPLSGSATTATGRGWQGIEVTGLIPSGCYEIQLRLAGQGATAVVEWGPVNFHWRNQRRIGLPARITSRERVGPLYIVTDPTTVANPPYFGDDMRDEVVGIIKEQVGDAVQLRYNPGLQDAPYFFSERVYYLALSSAYQTVANRVTGDAASTNCPLEYVTSAMVRLLAEQYVIRQPENAEFWIGLRTLADQKLVRYEREFGPKPQAHLERARRIAIPLLEV